MVNFSVVNDYNDTSQAPLWLSGDINSSSLVSPLVFTISIGIVLGIIIVMAIIGNSFVIAAFCLKPKLRKPTNYFILNLAVADLTLAILVLPMSAVYDIHGKWVFSSVVCLIWTVVDILVSTASIFTLVAISADRYMAIRYCLPSLLAVPFAVIPRCTVRRHSSLYRPLSLLAVLSMGIRKFTRIEQIPLTNC